nr:MAG TPA: Putative transferase, nesg, ydcK, Structural Genomics.38A [Caudoviricetes sp.]
MEAKKGRREMKKFELTTEFITNAFGKKLFRIKALVEFGDVKAGELGGYVEKEGNVSQADNAWVYGDARVYGDACVSGNARVSGNAWVSGNARVYGDARVYGNAEVYGDARVSGNADYALVQGFGTEFRCTTFYRGKNKKIMVNCGCFHGDLEGFRKQVKETRNGKIAKEYLMIADLMEYHFTSEDSSDE